MYAVLALQVEKHPEKKNEIFRMLRDRGRDGLPVGSGSMNCPITPVEAEKIIRRLEDDDRSRIADKESLTLVQTPLFSQGAPLPTPQQQVRSLVYHSISSGNGAAPTRGILRRRDSKLARDNQSHRHLKGLEDPKVIMEKVEEFKYLDLWFEKPGVSVECDDCGRTSSIKDGRRCGGTYGFSFSMTRFVCSTCLDPFRFTGA